MPILETISRLVDFSPNAIPKWGICRKAIAAVVAWLVLLIGFHTGTAAIPVIELGNTNVSALVTGGTSSLLSRVHVLDVDTNAPGGRIEFDFGFVTQEGANGSGFIDSVTLTLLDTNELSGVVLLVADANGVLWAPEVPGSIVLPSNHLIGSALELPEIRVGLSEFKSQMAYHVSVRIPSALWAPKLKLALDLFDYPNGFDSVAWIGDFLFVPDPTLECVPSPPGLVADWTADGDGLDSVGTFHAAVRAGVTFAEGIVGQAFHFDGTDTAYAQVANRTNLSPQAGLYSPADPNGGQMSLESWIQVASLSPASEGRRTIVSKEGEYELSVLSSGALSFQIWGLGEMTVTASGGQIVPGLWHHVAATFRQGQFLRIYIDGILVGQATGLSLVGFHGNAPLLLGRSSLNQTEHYYRGNLDDLGLYRHALSDVDVASIARSGSAGKCRTPLLLKFERRPLTLRLRWWRTAGGATLEQSDTVEPNAVWRPASQIPVLVDDEFVADIPLPDSNQFFRLRR